MSSSRMLRNFKLCLIHPSLKLTFKPHFQRNVICNIITEQNVHTSAVLQIKKHWDPRFRRLRAQKFLKVELPDYDKIRNDKKLTPEEIRSKMKEEGIAPPRPWSERPLHISSTGALIDPYVPPEGDGKISIITKAGAKQKMERLGKKGKSLMELRRLRKFEHDFDIPSFAEKALEIYIAAHTALAEKDEDKLHELVTEKCYPEMTYHTDMKTIRWKFIQSLEPSRVVHIRCADIITKENLFAHLTVRFHSQQTLAVYDRFGRLMYGSEAVVKDVLEYVVFEKHLANQYGSWRIHGKIIPDWMPPKENIKRTFRKPPTPPQEKPLETTPVVSTHSEQHTESSPAIAAA